MEYRPLGGTGVEVSKLCLGTMMFGAWGNTTTTTPSASFTAREQLAKVADEAGLSLIELAIAFVVNHPAVTSAITGPRTMEQLESQLPTADVALDDAILDRIDEIVRPGVTVNPADNSYGERGLQPSARRR